MLASIVILVWTMSSCGAEKGDGTNAPTLVFLGMSKDTMVQGQVGLIVPDSIVVQLRFEDIDGDIDGISSGNTPMNIFRIDSRDGSNDPASFPAFPDLSAGQRGTLDLTIFTTCCINPNQFQSCDPDTINTFNTFTYDIFIEDIQGNRSNTVTTPPITLLCR